jgi:hypothetical protein
MARTFVISKGDACVILPDSGNVLTTPSSARIWYNIAGEIVAIRLGYDDEESTQSFTKEDLQEFINLLEALKVAM